MNVDVLVIGAGPAGLLAAARAMELGQRVAVIARGYGSLPLAPGVWDLADGPDAVAMAERLAAQPGHPYAYLGLTAVWDGFAWFAALAERLGLPYDAAPDRTGWQLPTVAGTIRNTWLAPRTMTGAHLPTKSHLLLIKVPGFADWRTDFVAAQLSLRLTDLRVQALTLPPVRIGARQPWDALRWGAFLETDKGRAWLLAALRYVPDVSRNSCLLLPPGLGLRGAESIRLEIQQQLGLTVAEPLGWPPSAPGKRLQDALHCDLLAGGARLLLNAGVKRVESVQRRIVSVVTTAGEAIACDRVVLATGGFIHGGLEQPMGQGVQESVFGLPVQGQGLSAGVRVDAALRPLGPGGDPVWENLQACGRVLSGQRPETEHCGGGVTLASAKLAGEGVGR